MAGVLHIGHAHADGGAHDAAGQGNSVIIGLHIGQALRVDRQLMDGALHVGD